MTEDKIEVEPKVEVRESKKPIKTSKPKYKRTQTEEDGHCIRCSESIPYDMKSPYCKKHLFIVEL